MWNLTSNIIKRLFYSCGYSWMKTTCKLHHRFQPGDSGLLVGFPMHQTDEKRITSWDRMLGMMRLKTHTRGHHKSTPYQPSMNQSPMSSLGLMWIFDLLAILQLPPLKERKRIKHKSVYFLTTLLSESDYQLREPVGKSFYMLQGI